MVSVVITTYKRSEKIVERAIKSVIDQTYNDWELFIIDDSPDSYENRSSVKKMVEKYLNDKIHYYQQPQNMGACKARNRGIELSSGDFIAFLDDDDVWRKDKLEKQINKFKELDDRYALVYCGSIYYNETKDSYKKHKTILKSGEVFDDLIVQNFIGGSSFPLIRNDVIKKLGGFDEDLLASQDLDMWLRISKDYLIDYVDEPLVIYYLHDGEQISTSPKKVLQGITRKIEKNEKYLLAHPLQYSVCLYNLSYAEAMNHNIKEAKKAYKMANRKYNHGFLYRMISYIRMMRHYLKSK